MKVSPESTRQDCDMAQQIALNRPRSPVARVLYGMMILYGIVAIVEHT